jgi:hypothetical protein
MLEAANLVKAVGAPPPASPREGEAFAMTRGRLS